jgi:hypothetical protein
MKLAEYKPVIDVSHLYDNLQRVEQITDDAQRFFNNTRIRVVYYEDLVMDPKVSSLSNSKYDDIGISGFFFRSLIFRRVQLLNEIQEFLGVLPRKLESQQVKIHTRPLSEQIENWDEVLACLKGTKYEILVHDDDYT